MNNMLPWCVSFQMCPPIERAKNRRVCPGSRGDNNRTSIVNPSNWLGRIPYPTVSVIEPFIERLTSASWFGCAPMLLVGHPPSPVVDDDRDAMNFRGGCLVKTHTPSPDKTTQLIKIGKPTALSKLSSSVLVSNNCSPH